jgi:N-carbamoylputrescine amidase
MRLIIANGSLPSPARRREAPTHERRRIRLGAVQHRWHPDRAEHEQQLAEGVRAAVAEGAQLVCLQELTLSRYFATSADGPTTGGVEAESVQDGRTRRFAAALAAETGAHIHASLFEAGPTGQELGFNTAIVVAPDGQLLARTRKLHIPRTAGYHEDRYFHPGPAAPDPFPVVELGPAKLGFPTCWDQWFPELARAYALAGADLLVYPTAIGSEPDHPDFDTEPLWERVITANGIASGLFMVAVNRVGEEHPLRFYGSSFISDPYGRILVQAPRDEPAVLVADIDLDQRRDWLELFPFLRTRRPDAYGALCAPASEEGTVTLPAPAPAG